LKNREAISGTKWKKFEGGCWGPGGQQVVQRGAGEVALEGSEKNRANCRISQNIYLTLVSDKKVAKRVYLIGVTHQEGL